jgi:hypothetical protein
MTKGGVCKSPSQKRSPGVWESMRMNTHTPKWIPILGIGVPVDSQNFKERFQKSKHLALWSSLYHWKAIETYMSKMSSHDPFGHLKHKLWPKERPGVKLTVWLLTTRSQESTQFPCVQVACDTPLESSPRGLQLRFVPHPNQRSEQEVIVSQNCGTSNLGDFDGSPRTKSHSDATLVGRCIVYYMGEGGGFPQVRAVVSLVSLRSLVANQLICWFCAGLREQVNCLSFFLVPSQSSITPLYPFKVLRAKERASSP